MYVDTKHWCRHTLGINNAYVYCIVRYLIYNQLLSAENSVILGSYLLLHTAVQCFFQCCGSESFYVDSDPLISYNSDPEWKKKYFLVLLETSRKWKCGFEFILNRSRKEYPVPDTGTFFSLSLFKAVLGIQIKYRTSPRLGSTSGSYLDKTSRFFRIRSGFLADPDADSEKKSDPDPGKKTRIRNI